MIKFWKSFLCSYKGSQLCILHNASELLEASFTFTKYYNIRAISQQLYVVYIPQEIL